MSHNREALLDAIRAGDAEAVRSLLSADPSVAEVTDENGISALMLAWYHRQRAIANLLLEARGVDSLDVHEAAASGLVVRLRPLLDSDADAHLSWSDDGFTPLHLAAFFGRDEAVDVLLRAGAAVSLRARNAMKVQPLHSAAAAGALAICAKLLNKGADVNATQQGGFTALMAAAHAGNRELLDLLLQKGADATLENNDGKTAADLAREAGHDEIASWLDEP